MFLLSLKCLTVKALNYTRLIYYYDHWNLLESKSMYATM